MKRLRVLCSQKITGLNHKTEITQIGGVNGSGEKWKVSEKEAIAGIQTGLFEFYIVENFKDVPVSIKEEIVEGQAKKQLVATGLGFLHNLLEDLPDCP
ncbi:hypothetical protein [Algoriphagus vanfongensis]|uniref:hypothetical protein n=1 Tax=Algoriphagus vanfongensis TaxID=426371 RepID=UPI0004033C4F|nr:hypothetical protein [Algoriphagus vanfongensis]